MSRPSRPLMPYTTGRSNMSRPSRPPTSNATGRPFDRPMTRPEGSMTRTGATMGMTGTRGVTDTRGMTDTRGAPFTRRMTSMTRTGGPSAMTGGRTDRSSRGETMLSRLRPPAGFNDKPYRCCYMLPHHKLVFLFVVSLVLGFVMITGAIVAAVLGHKIMLWFVGAFMKLIGAGLCLMTLMRPTRNRILAYLTQTIMEMTLVVLGFICVTILLAVAVGKVEWRTKEKSEDWFGSETFRKEIESLSSRIGLEGKVLVGLAFLPMTGLLALLIVQVVALYRFTKYVDDRNEFLVRKGDATPVTDMTVMPPESTLAGGTMTLPPPPSLYRTDVTAGPTKGTPLETRRSKSDTLPKVRDETWVGSSRMGEQKGEQAKGSKVGSARKVPGGKTASPAPYASVNPPTPSTVERQRAERKWRQQQEQLQQGQGPIK